MSVLCYVAAVAVQFPFMLAACRATGSRTTRDGILIGFVAMIPIALGCLAGRYW